MLEISDPVVPVALISSELVGSMTQPPQFGVVGVVASDV